MLKIDKREMEYLTDHGVNFGENGISKTCSCHRRLHTYYLCESENNMKLHYEYQKNIGIKVPENNIPKKKRYKSERR